MPPRPRPRPRPVTKASSSSDVNGTIAGSSTGQSQGASELNVTAIPGQSSPTGARRVYEVHDTDEMFMRNRNRSSQTWQKLEQINKEIAKAEKDGSDGSGDDEEDSSPRRRKRVKKESSVAPVWQKSRDLARMLSEGLSDSSDEDDVVEVTGDYTPNGKRAKRKRQRSRSRSITPPPALPAQTIQNAKNVVRETLRAAVRTASPTNFDFDDSTDTIILDPEFLEIAQRVREQQRGSSQVPEGASGDEIVLTIKWKPHPLDAHGKEEVWQYKVDRTDNFRDLFEAVSEDAEVPTANLILTHQGKRFYPSVTPQTLKIWTDTAEFAAYEKTAFEHIEKNRAQQASQAFSQSQFHIPSAVNGAGPSTAIDLDSDSDPEITSGDFGRAGTPPTQTQTQESDAESEVDPGEKLKLNLRSVVTGSKDIALIVRPTTKCGAIVKAFLKKAGLAEQYPELFEEQGVNASGKGKGKKGRKSQGGAAAAKSGKDPRLCIDGDKMDNGTEIGEMDLEDGDMVEVVGL